MYKTSRIINQLLVGMILAWGLVACSSKTPYEVKSPCVAKEANNPYAIHPCIRKPVNMHSDIV